MIRWVRQEQVWDSGMEGRGKGRHNATWFPTSKIAITNLVVSNYLTSQYFQFPFVSKFENGAHLSCVFWFFLCQSIENVIKLPIFLVESDFYHNLIDIIL